MREKENLVIKLQNRRRANASPPPHLPSLPSHNMKTMGNIKIRFLKKQSIKWETDIPHVTLICYMNPSTRYFIKDYLTLKTQQSIDYNIYKD